MKILYLIPARGGSKGIPHKNSKLLAGKPLIQYAIENALQAAGPDDDICVSTDDDEVARIARGCGLEVPFKRPAELAQDHSGSYEVILHALRHYESLGRRYDAVVLLQPTSPFRRVQHILDAIALYTPECDMVVSVTEARSNPYYLMFLEDERGYLTHLLQGHFTRRQDCPTVYEYNGAVYVMNPDSLRQKSLAQFTRNRKYVMTPADSIDLDTPADWDYAEFLMRRE